LRSGGADPVRHLEGDEDLLVEQHLALVGQHEIDVDTWCRSCAPSPAAAAAWPPTVAIGDNSAVASTTLTTPVGLTREHFALRRA